jgi:hypothetical protein
MHTIVETPSYLADAKAAGLTEGERTMVVENDREPPGSW